MGSLFIILARALIVAPFLLTAVCGVMDYSGAAASFGNDYPQFAVAYPVILALQVLLGAVVILGLPYHRVIAGVLAVIVVLLAAWRAPFWNVMGAEEVVLMNIFVGALAQAGGLLLIAVMPKN